MLNTPMASPEDQELERTSEILTAATMIAVLEEKPSAVHEAKIKAIEDTIQRLSRYRKEGIRNDLVHTVFVKRMKLIDNAGTVQELKEIQKEPKPHYNGNGFESGPASVPEEEMILWSLATARAPLNEAGMKRYMELFQQVFGFLPWEDKAEEDQEVLK